MEERRKFIEKRGVRQSEVRWEEGNRSGKEWNGRRKSSKGKKRRRA